MKHLARLEYFVRHLAHVLPYVTAQKLVNMGLNAFELRFKVARPRSTPPYLKVEPTPLCHLSILSGLCTWQ